jgi:hypothetical protein
MGEQTLLNTRVGVRNLKANARKGGLRRRI